MVHIERYPVLLNVRVLVPLAVWSLLRSRAVVDDDVGYGPDAGLSQRLVERHELVLGTVCCVKVIELVRKVALLADTVRWWGQPQVREASILSGNGVHSVCTCTCVITMCPP